MYSFNSKGSCPVCGGRGQIVTELVFMDPVTTVCEACEGRRYSEKALSYRYHGKNIVEILDLSAGEAYEFFKGNKKLRKALGAMLEVGLPYLSLGQPLSTLSGGTAGGEIVFTGTPADMAARADTITADYLRKSL